MEKSLPPSVSLDFFETKTTIADLMGKIIPSFISTLVGLELMRINWLICKDCHLSLKNLVIVENFYTRSQTFSIRRFLRIKWENLIKSGTLQKLSKNKSERQTSSLSVPPSVYLVSKVISSLYVTLGENTERLRYVFSLVKI